MHVAAKQDLLLKANHENFQSPPACGRERPRAHPASFRKALGINAGDEVVLRIEDDELRITTLKRRLERAQRLVRKHVKSGTSLVDELIAQRRKSIGTRPTLKQPARSR